MKKILIIPDVHGRDFWIEPVKKVINNKDYFIVFLGDYLSCYPYEWEPGIDYNQIAIERFKEVLDFKKDNPEKVILLLERFKKVVEAVRVFQIGSSSDLIELHLGCQ